MNKSVNDNIELHHIFTQSENQVSAEINGETVMMSVEQGSYFGLDAIGSRIWNLMEQPISLQDMIDTLVEEYDVSEVNCKNDVVKFVAELNSRGLVHRH